MEGVTPERW